MGLRADGMRGKIPANTRPVGRARVALYKPWLENIDEGWTRWVLERHQFALASLSDSQIRAGGLRSQFDAIVLPSASAERLTMGHPSDAVPAEYAGGLGQSGVDALKAFVQEGGTLVCLDQSCELAISALNLDIRDVAREAGEKFFCPGSIVRIELDHRASAVLRHAARDRRILCVQFRVSPARRGGDVATYGPKDVLLSGWIEGEQAIAGQSAVVEAKAGAGRVVLLGFRVQHRGQSLATFRLLFNALLTAPPSRRSSALAPIQFTLLGSRFSVRVQVRFCVLGSRVRGRGSRGADSRVCISGTLNMEPGTGNWNLEPNVNTNREARTEKRELRYTLPPLSGTS